METKIKPFPKWEKLQMTTTERRKIMCSVTFHAIAITCVIWSLYVLIDRTTDEVKKGDYEMGNGGKTGENKNKRRKKEQKRAKKKKKEKQTGGKKETKRASEKYKIMTKRRNTKLSKKTAA